MDKTGNHKIELMDVGTMSGTEIVGEVQQIFEIDPRTLPIMRVDFAVDVPELPLQWFLESVRVLNKRFRSALTGQPFYGEMGKGQIETLYFGKRPNVIRIYDKMAEYRVQFRNLIRKLGGDSEPPSFESVFGVSDSNATLTRVERQIGGRIPEPLRTLERIMQPTFEFRPFSHLKIADHAPAPDFDDRVTFETRCTALFLRGLAQNEGMQAANCFISRYSNGNGTRVRNKYASSLTANPLSGGITDAQLHSGFQESLVRQMSRRQGSTTMHVSRTEAR